MPAVCQTAEIQSTRQVWVGGKMITVALRSPEGWSSRKPCSVRDLNDSENSLRGTQETSVSVLKSCRGEVERGEATVSWSSRSKEWERNFKAKEHSIFGTQSCVVPTGNVCYPRLELTRSQMYLLNCHYYLQQVNDCAHYLPTVTPVHDHLCCSGMLGLALAVCISQILLLETTGFCFSSANGRHWITTGSETGKQRSSSAFSNSRQPRSRSRCKLLLLVGYSW